MFLLRRSRAALTALAAALVAAGMTGCGDDKTAGPAAPATTSSSADPGAGEWLLRFTTAGGDDGEKAGAVYVRYDPATGTAAARTLPAVTASDASATEEVLLVSADHTRAIQDTGVPRSQARTGKLLVYSLGSDAIETLDIRAATGRPGLRAVAWAFDPTDPDVMRVVDSDRAVWKVDLAAKSATQEATLPTRSGWIFGNGFDRNTGEPYIESIDSDQTDPAGNGDADSRPVHREGGTPFVYDGSDLAGLPKPPCDFAGGFSFDAGVSWLFCADNPSITAYQAAQGGVSWHRYGAASTGVVPKGAVELTFALPPPA
ncbi:hypothetical protein ACVW00_004246 [Marmoricola sp. URHA0025 HA25]